MNTMIDDASEILRELAHSADSSNDRPSETEVESFLQSLVDAQNDRMPDDAEVTLVPRKRRTPPQDEEEASPQKKTRVEEESGDESIMYDASECAPRALLTSGVTSETPHSAEMIPSRGLPRNVEKANLAAEESRMTVGSCAD